MKVGEEKQFQALKEPPVRKKKFKTDIGIDIKPYYTPADLSESGFNYDQDLGQPGGYPFTRGITPEMYRREPWITRAY